MHATNTEIYLQITIRIRIISCITGQKKNSKTSRRHFRWRDDIIIEDKLARHTQTDTGSICTSRIQPEHPIIRAGLVLRRCRAEGVVGDALISVRWRLGDHVVAIATGTIDWTRIANGWLLGAGLGGGRIRLECNSGLAGHR
jgi:hypothetical protein